MRIVVQGITGERGLLHTQQMLDSGTPIMGGITPGKGGEWAAGVPVFDTVRAAVEMIGANTSIIFVPQHNAADAIYEAIDAKIDTIVCISDGIPIADMTRIYEYTVASHSRLIGPNCPGILTPGVANIGIFPANLGKAGHTGVVSKGGAMIYEVIDILTRAGIGQSTCVGIGGDPIVGTSYVEILEMFEADPLTESVVLLGEIGGRAEIDAAEFIKRNMTKPVTALIAGLYAPEGRRMGHAGAIIESSTGSAQQKIAALRDAGARITQNPDHIPDLLRF
jgi:succinyl-CoA synthetase alpha subunit